MRTSAMILERDEPTPQTEDPAVFIDAMSAAATPVSIVATDGAAGRFGVTVSAVASVSAEPPMVLCCVNRKSPAASAIERNGVFCLNMLTESQRVLANCFAGRAEAGAPYDFGRAVWRRAVSGAPVLDAALASFDCALESAYDAGAHRIMIGRVLRASGSQNQPLVYARRAYRALRPAQ